MNKKRQFLMLAIGVGIVGVIIGGITIWYAAKDLLQP
jgi:hypothetical protein